MCFSFCSSAKLLTEKLLACNAVSEDIIDEIFANLPMICTNCEEKVLSSFIVGTITANGIRKATRMAGLKNALQSTPENTVLQTASEYLLDRLIEMDGNDEGILDIITELPTQSLDRLSIDLIHPNKVFKLMMCYCKNRG